LLDKIQLNPSLLSQRVVLVDVSKGMLIILVVFGHAWRAVFNNDILHNTIIYHFVDDLIYAFHMPAFFFLAGLFALKTKKQAVGEFIGKKLRTIAYPYFLWSIIQSVIQLVMSGSTTRTITITDIFKIPLVPIMQFWFLYALFFVFLFFIMVRQLTASPIVFFCIGLFLFIMLRSGFPFLPLPFIYLANNFIYFSAGIVWSRELLIQQKLLIRNYYLWVTCYLLLLGISFAVAYMPVVLPQEKLLWLAPLFAIPGGMLVFSTAKLFQVLQLEKVMRLFQLLGLYSLEIFLAHTLFSAGFRITTTKIFGVVDMSIHLIGATTLGILGPLLLVFIARGLGGRFLFIWPSRGY